MLYQDKINKLIEKGKEIEAKSLETIAKEEEKLLLEDPGKFIEKKYDKIYVTSIKFMAGSALIAGAIHGGLETHSPYFIIPAAFGFFLMYNGFADMDKYHNFTKDCLYYLKSKITKKEKIKNE